MAKKTKYQREVKAGLVKGITHMTRYEEKCAIYWLRIHALREQENA